MIDLFNFKVGDKLGTIYYVYEFCGKVETKKFEGCVLETLSVEKHSISYCVKDNQGRTVCSWYGSPPYWGTKVKEIFFSLDDACMTYKNYLEDKIEKLSKEIAIYKRIVLYGLKEAFE